MGVIVQRVAEGETLKGLAAAWRVPYGRLAQWIVEDKTRSELYVNAKALCETARADEVHALTDGVTSKLELGIANLKFKATQWAAAKWNPARFGDSSSVSVAVKDERVLDQDTLMIETARALALVMSRGNEIAKRREKEIPRQLAGPVSGPAPAASAPDDEGLI